MSTIIIDIDGVLSPVTAGKQKLPEGYLLYTHEEAKAYLNVPQVKTWLENLIINHNVVWGSFRQEQSNHVLNMLGLAQYSLPYIPIDTNDVGLGTWKIKSIKKWLAENIPAEETVIWVEDELEKDAYLWAEQRKNMFLIKPELHIGLLPEHLNEIDNILKR